jgi:predicted Ser/Thr protein kinase
MTTPQLQLAFDLALARVERLLGSNMKTAKGISARSQLEKLEKELKKERALALERQTVDREWLQRTVRWVVEWIPDNELALVAALGAIVRAAPSSTSSP